MVTPSNNGFEGHLHMTTVPSRTTGHSRGLLGVFQEACAAILGQGRKLDKSIKNGMQWLLHTISDQWEKLDARVNKDIAEQREREKQERKERVEIVRKIREERYKVLLSFLFFLPFSNNLEINMLSASQI